MPVTRAGGGEALAGRWLLEQQRDIGKELGLVGLDRQQVVAAFAPDQAAEGALAVERIARHHPPRQP